MRILISKWAYVFAALAGVLAAIAVEQENARRRRQSQSRRIVRDAGVRSAATVQPPRAVTSPPPAPAFEVGPSYDRHLSVEHRSRTPRGGRSLPRAAVAATVTAVLAPAVLAVVGVSTSSTSASPTLSALPVDHTQLLVRGENFEPGRAVHLYWDAPSQDAIVATASDDGLVLASIPLPGSVGTDHDHAASAGLSSFEEMTHTLMATDGSMQAMLPVTLTQEGAVLGVKVAPTSTAVPAASVMGVISGSCWPNELPLGAIAGQPGPVFCNAFTNAPSSFVSSGNSWTDDFNVGVSMATMGSGYVAFDKLGTINQGKHWQHADHWMVDVNGYDQTPNDGPWNFGGATVRPNRSFRWENRTWTSQRFGVTRTEPMMVVEAQVAAGIADYAGNAWPELVITTASAPTSNRKDGTYNYDQYAGHDTVGCRLGGGRVPTCALFDNTKRGSGQGGRTWEISHFQSGGGQWWGGSPYSSPLHNAAWRVCEQALNQDPDTMCRDSFRWEISKTRQALFVNGFLYMEHVGFTPIPDRFLQSDVYVYFGSWIFKPDAATVRFHWDHVSINPASTQPATPTATTTSGPAPTNTTVPTALPTSTAPVPTATNPAPTATSTPVPPQPTPTSAPPTGTCWPSDVPVGALPGQPLPVFCNNFGNGPSTFVSGVNSWIDNFDHGLSMSHLGAGYVVFENVGSNNKTKHWRHSNHWMVDVNGYDQTPNDGPWNLGGATVRPDRSFRWETRTWTSARFGITRTEPMMVVEAQAAAGIADYAGSAWPELVITTASAPTFNRRDGIYNYDMFAGHDTVGCRLQDNREPICALFDNTTRGPGEGGRTWEISHFQSGGGQWWGGGPFSSAQHDAAWRVCRQALNQDPDTMCRDTFRWEISRTRQAVYVNGFLYMEHVGFTPIPDRFLTSDVYVYFGSWIFKPDAATARFHWDKLAINP